jgi:hypothetical protein
VKKYPSLMRMKKLHPNKKAAGTESQRLFILPVKLI